MLLKQGDIVSVCINDSNYNFLNINIPILVISNNVINRFSTSIIGIIVDTELRECGVPSHHRLDGYEYPFDNPIIIKTEEVITINKINLQSKITSLTDEDLKQVMEKFSSNFQSFNENII